MDIILSKLEQAILLQAAANLSGKNCIGLQEFVMQVFVIEMYVLLILLTVKVATYTTSVFRVEY